MFKKPIMSMLEQMPAFKDMLAKFEDIKRREQKKANREKYSYLLDPTTDSFNPNEIDQQLLTDLRDLDFSQPSALAPRKQKPSALVGIPVFDTDITRQLYGEEYG
jgi:hypothetical protein